MRQPLVGAAVVVVLTVVALGPAFLDVYRLQHYIMTADQTYQADGGPWPHVTDVCIGCHGVEGASQHQGYPSLAGQPEAYLTAQLHNFASGRRTNPNMGPLAMMLSDAEIRVLAHYFGNKTVAGNHWFEPDVALRRKGEELTQTGGCAACHGGKLMGHDQYPRLAAQGYDYLVKQLDAYAAGTRADPTGVMNQLTSVIAADDRRAIATYMASMTPGRPELHFTFHAPERSEKKR